MISAKDFTREESMALFAVVSGTAGVDQQIDQLELNFLNTLMFLLHLTEEEKKRALSHSHEAIAIIRQMPYEKKYLISCLLSFGIIADGKLLPIEEDYRQFVSLKCDLPIETNYEKANKVVEDFYWASK